MKRWHKVLLVCLGLGIAGYVVQDKMATRYEKKLNRALEQERDEFWDKIGILEKNVADLEEELSLHQETVVPEEKLAEVFGEGSPVPSPEQTELGCEELERQVKAVFAYLDNKQYVKAYNLEGGTYGLFQALATQLSEKPPIISGEMKDMVSLARNVAHFFRVLGNNRIELFKEVLRNESDIVEAMMTTFFSWFMACDRCEPSTLGCPSLKVLYQYSGFFLNTLAGKSYLSRRDSKVRVLMSYYSVLILDKANQEMLNRDGIDIRHFIYSLFYDVRNQKGLIHKRKYLEELAALREDYQT